MATSHQQRFGYRIHESGGWVEDTTDPGEYAADRFVGRVVEGWSYTRKRRELGWHTGTSVNGAGECAGPFETRKDAIEYLLALARVGRPRLKR